MRIALTGPMYSGKSTVAKILEGLYGYTLVSGTTYLKQMAVTALSPYVDGLTVAKIEKEKDKYRPFLQEFGLVIGFNTNPKFITDILPTDAEDIVFDNVRFDTEWEILEPLGFKLVRLDLDNNEIMRRAEHMGLATWKVREQLQHVSENGVNYDAWKTYDTSRSSAETIAKLITEGKAQPPAQRQHRGNFENEVTQDMGTLRAEPAVRTTRTRPTRSRTVRGTSLDQIALDQASWTVPTQEQRERHVSSSSTFYSSALDPRNSPSDNPFSLPLTPGQSYTVHTGGGRYMIQTSLDENGNLVARTITPEVTEDGAPY